jgi:hypothetical protein
VINAFTVPPDESERSWSAGTGILDTACGPVSDTASAAPFLLPGLLLIAVTPHVLAESRAQLPHRHFDLAGAAAITGGMMLLVYAMTRATQVGWGAGQTLVLLIASAVLLTGFVAIELRSKAPILPLRIFGLRTLTGANVASLLLGAAMFSMFFLLTLYMQNVLGYSAIKTGVAYLTLTLSIIVFSNPGQALTTRIGRDGCCHWARCSRPPHW